MTNDEALVDEGPWQILTEFTLPSAPGQERQAMERVTSTIQGLQLSQKAIDRLGTAVAEATLNAMEHGNDFIPEKEVQIRVATSPSQLVVRITDQGGLKTRKPAETPSLEAKLVGEQSPRGWGLFLIQNMVDEVHSTTRDARHTLELVVRLEGNTDGKKHFSY